MEEIRNQLSALTKLAKDNERKMDAMQGDIQRIQQYLYDDPQTSSVGAIAALRQLTLRVLKLEEIEKIRKARNGVYSVIGGAIGMLFIKIIYWAVLKFL